MRTSRLVFLAASLISCRGLAQTEENASASAAVQAVAASALNGSVTATVTPTNATATTTATTAAPLTPPIVPEGTTPPAATRGETTLTLDIAFGIRAVLPSRVTVPVGELLRISAPGIGPSVQWQKNGRAIPGATANPLVLSPVTSSDAGTYTAVNSDPVALGFASQSLVLGVGGTERLLNLSARGLVGPGGDQGLVTGFVVEAGSQSKKLILRAVGPTLALFDVPNPLRRPVLRIFDGKGQPYTNGYLYPAVVGGPTYESDLADSLARTGAFPLPADTADVVLMMPFRAGAYTAHITSGDGTSGAVLFELYEVP